MKFDWDESKNETNYRKHGIWFEEAQKVFQDPQHRVFYDETHSKKEDRYIAVGHSESERLLLVIYCFREPNSMIRIISARKATKKERQFYEKRI